jgi:hypothetical protein
MTEIYVSTDVEADGPIPGPRSMLSFGSAAYCPDKKFFGTFSANLETLQERTVIRRRCHGARRSPMHGKRAGKIWKRRKRQ